MKMQSLFFVAIAAKYSISIDHGKVREELK